ncbi:MAG: tryptophan--tRNA ligase [candidate division KSB1 bacterium]|nr:tryptophan--tRNA ligase [candidate division KSB1 bacterium]MDZ7294086.1 tryptophan--tRNA ligase [candidate division KSB1 bacterium]MDZ7393520.1 tryptophan--tRNA ligase [candidate division KSB1 bacterium]MDZ7413377.1 tryptophan--tRNA ligase [candidate division KSB1 bacterium]
MGKKRILSGMRPTGRLHLGNYVGALENWVRLQGEYENFHMVADWHTLTTSYEDTSTIGTDTVEMVIDWLAAGIDPEKSVLFVQSQVKEHAELFLLFAMLVTVPRLERNPTVKEQARALGLDSRMSYGHLGYPVLQAADILIYRAHAVPVGEDQVPHVELTREIARRFNSLYGEVFPEPEAMLTEFARLPGLDGNRMSKSAGNTILLSDRPEEIQRKVMTAVTDPQKIRRGDPGRPEVCLVFTFHRKFNPSEVGTIERDCRSGALGCVDCKKNLANKLTCYLQPIREKREYYAAHLDQVQEIIAEGNARARAEAARTMALVRAAMRIG